MMISCISSLRYCNRKDDFLNKFIDTNKFNDSRISYSEIQQVRNYDIPYFYINGESDIVKDIFDNEVYQLNDYPSALINKQIDCFSTDDLKIQKNYIEFIFNVYEQLIQSKISYYNLSKYDTCLKNNISIDRVIEIIKNKLFENIVISEDHTVNWLDFSIGESDGIEFNFVDSGLYKGLSGIGISLIELFRYNHDNNILQLIKLIKNSIVIDLNDLSYFNGISGQLYFLVQYCKYIENVDADIDNLFMKLYDARDNLYNYGVDIVSGVSGIILFIFFNKEYFLDRSKEVKEILYICGKVLENKFDDNLCIFKQGDNYLDNCSFAHGNSGVLVALKVLNIELNNDKYDSIFQKSLSYEKNMILNDGWIDNRRKDNQSSANWCHGSTGILVSRLLLLSLHKKYEILNDNAIRQILCDIDHAIENILNLTITMSSASLCHGIIGNILILDYVKVIDKDIYKKYNLNSKIQNIYDKFVKYLYDNEYKIDFSNKGINANGIMCGLSGILYGILKLQNKDKDNILFCK